MISTRIRMSHMIDLTLRIRPHTDTLISLRQPLRATTRAPKKEATLSSSIARVSVQTLQAYTADVALDRDQTDVPPGRSACNPM